MTYKNHIINRIPHNGYYYSYTKNGRVLADTLTGIKKLITDNI